MTFYVVLPVRRCPVRGCGSAFVGTDARCGDCQRALNDRTLMPRTYASKRDITNHKRLSFRRRLGLLAEGEST